MTTEQMLREALQRIQYKAKSLADAQVIALEALALPTTEPVQSNEWRDMIQERFDINYSAMPDDPRKAVLKLIGDEVAMTLDPACSSQAEALIQRGRDEVKPTTQAQEPAACDGGTCGIGGYCNDCTQPQAQDHIPDAGKMVNGLTEAATDQSASVAGLSATDEGAIALYEHPAADLTDELLRAVEANHHWHIDYDDTGTYEGSELCDQNRAIIAKVKGVGV